MTLRLLLATLVMFAAASAESSQGISYHARLSEQDHYNAGGRRLRSVAAILEQDRANFHRFGKRDRSDQTDPFFKSGAHRALFRKMTIFYRNFGDHPAKSIVNEYLDVDVIVIDRAVYVTVSAG
jgi:hypothetical protein